MTLTLKSSAFDNGSPIPPRHAKDGDNLSPPLSWSGVPPGTRSFVLIVEDPDAPSGTFRHWAVYDIAADCGSLPEAADGDFHQATNDFGHRHYDGPRPPRGHGAHHYHFRLAALTADRLNLPASARAEAVWQAARPHVLAEADLIGTFEQR